MKKGIRKTLLMIIALTIIFQMLIPIIPELNIEVFAADETSKETEEISRNYEVKEEETWDISANRDGSVIAKWTLKDRTLRISGTGEMRDWEFYSKEDWHNTQYTNVIENVMIENGITSIGSYAFKGCSSLESIIIPSSVTSIGSSVFFGCSSLKSINISSSVTSIGSDVFYGCSSLESITIPSSVTRIGSSAFEGCSSLESIEIPESVTSIGSGAFSGCSNLESINIPSSVTSIEYSAFEGCSSLESITILSNVTSIGGSAFEGCSSLESINVDINNKKYVSEDGILFNKEKTEIINYPAGKKDIQEYVIPSNVTTIRGSAFEGCSSLESINIPEGLTSIGWSAFERCSSLKSINIPESVTSIGGSAFEGCSSLKSISIPSSVTSIENSAFEGCSSLESITIPSNVTSIEGQAFYRCSSLKSIEIPESVTSIGYNAFRECSSLKDITIPEGVTSIGSYAFYECSSLKSINIPSSVTSIESNAIGKTTIIYTKLNSEGHRYAEEREQGYILEGEETENTEEISRNHEIKEEETWDVSANGYGSVTAKWTLKDRTLRISGTGEMKDWKYYSRENWHNTQYMNVIEKIIIVNEVTSIGRYAFSGCSSLKSINIPSSVTSIENGAFEGCSNLESIEIPESVTSIGYSAFRECSSLKDITIPEGVTSIGSYAFNECSSLKSINIPSSVTSIGEYAFYRCSSLESITIPSSVTSIENRTFYGCSSLKSINVDINNKKYVSEDGILFNKEKTEIINYPAGKKDIKEYVIPSSVTSIGSEAFEGCNSLESIEIPESVTSIGSYAFRECSSLKSINIPEGVTSIGGYAFSGCSSLKSINIPENVTSIGSSAFEGCSSLESITISSSVTRIGSSAFSGCSSLGSIDIPSSVTSIGSEAFEGCSSLKSINIPEGVTSIEDRAFSGCSSLESIDIPSSVTSIEYSAFEGCSSLGSIDIPSSVTSIEYSAFEGCSSLESIDIPNSVTSIEYSAFEGCSSLGSIDIPSSVTSIEYSAFEGCSGLESIDIPSSVTSIGREAFYGCSSLTSINIPESVTSIGNRTFYGCSSLESIIISNGVTSIGDESFSKCNKLIIYTNLNSKGHRYAEENEQSYIIDDEGPTATFTPNGNHNPQKGHTVKVNVEDDHKSVGVEKGSLKYLWTQSEEVPIKESFTQGFENGQTITKNIGDGIWYLWVYAKDNLDNETIKRSESFNFDNTAPSVNVQYSTKDPTNKNTEVKLTSNEEIQELEGWTLSNDKKTLEKQYSVNTKETVIVKDIAGNETKANIEINNIDKVAPKVEVEYSTKELTRENVKVTISSNEQIQNVEGWTLSEDKKVLTKEYKENIQETIVVKDLAGNETEVNININNIDKVAPNVKVEYSTEELTRENVVVRITSNEEIQEIEGWEISEDKKVLTREYSENIEETVIVKDIAGNEKEVEIEISNIDKNGLIKKIEYSTKNPTKENVKVTIFTNEEIEEIEGWELSENKKELTKEYSENQKETIVIKDLKGNKLKINIRVENIDREEPKVQVEYSTKEITRDNVVVKIKANEELQEIEGWTLSEDKKELTKEYNGNTSETITIRDLAGNETEVTIEITNIDKVAPVLNITYSTKNPTKENVKVTITSNEEIQSIEGWALSSDKKTLTKEYSANTKETIIVKDLAGNETEATIEITNIDKVAPALNVTYSTKNPTKENVKVTITSNEQIQSVTGWALSSDKKTLTKEYTANVKETIIVKDLAGNETRVTIEIDNIEGKPEITIGDINEDEKIDITDFLMLKRHLIAGNRRDWILTGNRLLAADMNENGKVDISDVLILKRNIINNL